MKTLHKPILILLATSLLTTTACNKPNPNQNTATQAPTTPENDLAHKKVSDLTPTEQKTFIETSLQIYNNARFADDMILAACNLEAAFILGNSLEGTPTDTETQTACAKSRTECIADMKSSRKDAITNATAEMEDLTHCTFTVAQFDACAHDTAAVYKKIASTFTPCESQTLKSIQAAAENAPFAAVNDPLPPSCDIVNDICPGAF